MLRLMLLLLVVTFTCGFNVIDRPMRYMGGISGSAASSARLMDSEDPLWKAFLKCKLKANKDFGYDITYTPGVKAMNGREITISGFMLPLEAKDKSRHFLLERRAPTCAFCPPGGPNEIIEVFSTKALAWNENEATFSGTLILPNDAKKGVFFQLKDAVAR